MVQNNKITQENDSHLITIISYLQVVDNRDGVPLPADHHGADPGPGSLLRIELQDVVQSSVESSPATCIVLYYYTNCMVITMNHEQSPGYHCLYLSLTLYCPVWRPSACPVVRGEQQSRSRRWRRGGGAQCCPDS